jgi:hypothetical protein
MSDDPPASPRPGPLASEQISHERKTFFLDLMENQRGRFFKISEQVASRRNTIMVPIEAARDLLEALKRLAEFESQL